MKMLVEIFAILVILFVCRMVDKVLPSHHQMATVLLLAAYVKSNIDKVWPK